MKTNAMFYYPKALGVLTGTIKSVISFENNEKVTKEIIIEQLKKALKEIEKE